MTSEEIRSSLRKEADTTQAEFIPCVIVYALAEIAAQIAEGQVSLRDRLAMAAMQGLFLAAPAKWYSDEERKMFALESYAIADAMLEAKVNPIASPVSSPVVPDPDVDAEPSYAEQISAAAEHKARLAEPVSDPEKFVRCIDCCKEIPRPTWAAIGENCMCDLCIPF